MQTSCRHEQMHAALACVGSKGNKGADKHPQTQAILPAPVPHIRTSETNNHSLTLESCLSCSALWPSGVFSACASKVNCCSWARTCDEPAAGVHSRPTQHNAGSFAHLNRAGQRYKTVKRKN